MFEAQKLKKTVTVEVAQTQSFGTDDPVEIREEVVGSLYCVDDETYILAFDREIGGRKVTTTVKVSDGQLSVVNIGDVHSRQTFAPDEWYASQFFYSGGSVVCRNYTKKLEYAMGQDGGLIEVLYELWSGDTHLGFYHQEFFVK